MSLLIHGHILRFAYSANAPQLTNVINWMLCSFFFHLSMLFAELTLLCFKVSARHKHLLRAALYTSAYPFISSPVPPHAVWKMGEGASAAEEARSVLPRSVTNASLDTWRGHSSRLSLGHNVPLCYLLLFCLYIRRAHAVLCCTHPRTQKFTGTGLRLCFIVVHSLSMLPPASLIPLFESHHPLQSLIGVITIFMGLWAMEHMDIFSPGVRQFNHTGAHSAIIDLSCISVD